jgi:hypothetical protein
MHYFFGASLVIFTALCVGCQSGGGSPESVAKDFVMAMDSRDTATALALATPESDIAIRMISSILPAGANTKHAQIDKLTCTTAGDKSTCKYCCDMNGRDQTLNLVRIAEKWRVSYKKDIPNFAPALDSLAKKDDAL